MTGDHIVIAIEQNWDIEPEGFDAPGNLPDLLFVVSPRFAGSRLSSSMRRTLTVNVSSSMKHVLSTVYLISS